MNITRILGLDLGTNSIGWAILEDNQFVDMGSYIFTEVVDSKTKAPNNHKRREKRGVRRQLMRRHMRIKRMLRMLIKYGLLPHNRDERNAYLRSVNPYKLRYEALSRQLELYEIGAIMYHLAHRRGFKSNRKDSTKEKETGVIKESIGHLERYMQDNNIQTLGEYLYKEQQNGNKLRQKWTSRKMYEDEFDTIYSIQKGYNTDILTDMRGTLLRKELFYQRPLRIQKNLIGNCTYEKHRKRAHRASRIAERFRILQEVNNLKTRIIKEDSIHKNEYLPLEEYERIVLLDALYEHKKLSISKIHKLLKHNDTVEYNLLKDKSELLGHSTDIALENVLGDIWHKYSDIEKDNIVYDMLTIDTDEALYKRFRKHYEYDEEIIDKLMRIKLKEGYMSLSEKAIKKLLPYLEKGYTVMGACKEVGYMKNAILKYNTKDYESALSHMPNLRNPVVDKALRETKKLLLHIAKTYGRIDIIRMEMASDLKNSQKDKDKIIKIQRQNEKEKASIKEYLESRGISISYDTILRYRLFRECGGICVYTGRPISVDNLFSGEVDIEHILPLSRSLDDSYTNKTLCYSDFNRHNKQNMTPYEYGQSDNIWYTECLERVKKHLPPNKQKLFIQESIDLDGFTTRHLNDTRYICMAVKAFLERLGAEVEVSRGSLTSALRHDWGMHHWLSDGDKKDRTHHKHHALDALITAFVSRSMLRKASNTNKYGKDLDNNNLWESVKPDQGTLQKAQNKLSDMLVAHSLTRHITGAFHEETAYGKTENEGIYVTRKGIESITNAKQLANIRDNEIRDILQRRLEEYDYDAKKAYTTPLYHKDGKTTIKTIRCVEPISNAYNYRGESNTYFKYGNNHHTEIIRHKTLKDKHNKLLQKGFIISTLETIKRVRKDKKSVVNYEGPWYDSSGKEYKSDEWECVMSLCINDMVRIDNKIYRLAKMTAGSLCFVEHYIATSFDYTDKEYKKQISENSFDGVKIQVSPIGILCPVSCK